MAQRHHIGIAGCGIGGLAAACFLKRQGHAVTVFDQFDEPSPVGSGLVIQPVGLTCLEKLGLLETVTGRGQAIYQMQGIESASRRTVLRVAYGSQGGDRYGLAIHRAELFTALYTQALALGATIIGSTHVTATQLDGEQRIILSDKGDIHGPFDLVIDASGVGSNLSPIRTNPLPYGALWGTVDWPDDTRLPTDRLSQCYRRAHHMLGVLPLGHKQQTAIFWSEPQNSLQDWVQGDLDTWKTQTIRLWPEFAPFVDQITSHADMSPAFYRHGTLKTPYTDRMAFIGDAAHQASPQLGQGANMALLDAIALSEALNRHPIPEALLRYAAQRRRHVRFYQMISNLFTPFYQSRNSVLPMIRNNVFHPASQIWPLNRGLTQLVSGSLVSTGI